MTILHGGIATFLKAPVVEPERSALEAAGADVAVIGLPDDTTTVTRPGASHGPRAVRDASAHFAFGEYYHYDYDVTISDYLTIVDCGDIDAVAGNAARTFERAAAALDELRRLVPPGADRRRPRHDDPGRRALAAHRRRDGLRHVRHPSRHGTRHRRGRARTARPSTACSTCPTSTAATSSSRPTGRQPQIREGRRRRARRTVFSVRDIDRLGIDEVARRASRSPPTAPRPHTSPSTSTLDGAFAWGTCGPEIGGMTGRSSCVQSRSSPPARSAPWTWSVSPFLDPSGNTARAGARVIDVLALRAIAVREATAPVAAAGRG
jgi:agmatinase